jgi:hypothetical protein
VFQHRRTPDHTERVTFDMAEKIIPPVRLNSPSSLPAMELLYQIVALGGGRFLGLVKGVSEQDDLILFDVNDIRPIAIAAKEIPADKARTALAKAAR